MFFAFLDKVRACQQDTTLGIICFIISQIQYKQPGMCLIKNYHFDCFSSLNIVSLVHLSCQRSNTQSVLLLLPGENQSPCKCLQQKISFETPCFDMQVYSRFMTLYSWKSFLLWKPDYFHASVAPQREGVQPIVVTRVKLFEWNGHNISIHKSAHNNRLPCHTYRPIYNPTWL